MHKTLLLIKYNLSLLLPVLLVSVCNLLRLLSLRLQYVTFWDWPKLLCLSIVHTFFYHWVILHYTDVPHVFFFNPFTHRRITEIFPSFDDYHYSSYKYVCSDICVNVKFWFHHKCFNSMGMELVDLTVNIYLALQDTINCFLEWLYYFVFQPSMYESFSIILPFFKKLIFCTILPPFLLRHRWYES